MNYLKTVFLVIMAFFTLVANELTAIIPAEAPEVKSEKELCEIADMFDSHSLAEEVCVVRASQVSKDEWIAIQSLQGLVGRDKAAIFINYGNDSATELAEIERSGSKLLYTDENGEKWSLSNLVPRFSSYISNNSYVLFTNADTTEQINMAFNYSSVYGYLAVPEKAEDVVKALGMKKAEDLTDKEITIFTQREFYKEHKSFFRKDSLVHQASNAQGLRDFAVQQKIFITFTMDDNELERAFRGEILSDLNKASVVLGWCQYEIAFTEFVSSFGHFVIPSDHSMNMSILNCLDSEKITMGSETEAFVPDPEKHYVAIVYSDGDNAQWVSNGYSDFYKWQSYDIDAPITWTFPPLMNEFSPAAVKKVMANKGDDSFITGPSGIGYARISKMSADELSAYSDMTASSMYISGMTTVTLLDKPLDLPGSLFENKLSYFARYDNIKGGILQIDPTRYEGGKGKVFFVNDKPFVSVRLSLWYPTNNASDVTAEWLKEQAEIVNSYPADINSISGYTVINVHPWTVGADDLAYFVSQLDSGVEVISADRLIQAITENVPHKTAEP